MLHTKFRGDQPAGSGVEDFLKDFYHLPSCSCDQHHINIFSLPCTQKLTDKIWLKMPKWFLRIASFNFHM